VDSFFHLIKIFAVLNSGFINDCYKNFYFFLLFLRVQKYTLFPNLQNIFAKFTKYICNYLILNNQIITILHATKSLKPSKPELRHSKIRKSGLGRFAYS